MTRVFAARSSFDVTPAEAFAWHARPGALERCTPPWQDVRVLERAETLENGSRVTLSVPVLGPIRRRWVARHEEVATGARFVDTQLSGPFASWVHEHRFEAEPGGRGCTLEDRIEYELPGGVIGRIAAGSFVERTLRRVFAYRHALLRGDLERHRAYGAGRPRRIAVTGSSGFVGSALVPFLSAGGHEVVPLVRGGRGGGIAWDPANGTIDAAALEGLDAVVHLAGESVASGRWTAARKRRILESRAAGTRLLAETLARLERKPRVLVAASAIGVYGDRGDERLDESSAPGAGFLAQVCREWEEATGAAERAGIRVVHARVGIVLGAAGGALRRMLLPFRMGAGGRIGNGRQWMSWIALDDLLGVLGHAIFDESVRGALNAVAPEPVINAELARTLGHVLDRPAVAPLPALAVRLVFGEMGRELLLSSQRVESRALERTGFELRHPRLEGALRFELGLLEPEPPRSLALRAPAAAAT